VIGAAALLCGLLLLLSWLLATRLVHGATVASWDFRGASFSSAPPVEQSRGVSWLRAFAFSPLHPATWYANGALLLGFVVTPVWFGIVVALFSTGASTLFVFGLGIVFIAMGIEASRLFARFERWRARLVDPSPLQAHGYHPLQGPWRALLKAEFADENRWRDVLHTGIAFPLVILELTVAGVLWIAALALVTSPLWYDATGGTLSGVFDAIAQHDPPSILLRFALGAVLLPIAASASQLLMALHRAVVAGLLCTSESRELRREVETLRESRSAVLDAEASELRRIERDLHDGAQQRLVMLNLDLGMARERIDSDPETAKRLVLESQEQARQALSELRNLVRGMAPAILLDRGLTAALASVAAQSVVPTALHSDLPQGERLPDAVERAAYFVVTEALANAAKHSEATHCEISMTRTGSQLLVEIRDDGKGGAVVAPGGGLAGLAGRVAGVDGRLSVTSPAGGPTVVMADLPLWLPQVPR
jgi:signal transduction histidine kinase